MTSKSKIVPNSIEPVPKMPTHVVIFKVECSPYWWTRCYVNKRYVVRTTKSTDKREAYRFAKEVYTDALLNVKANPKSKTKSRSFAVLANSLVEYEKTTAKLSLYQNDKGKVQSVLIPYFGSKNIDEIEYADLVKLLEELSNRGLSPATKKHYLSLVSKIFKFAVQEGVLKVIPQFPKLSERLKTQQKRDYLENNEYIKLNNTISKMASKGMKVRGVAITEELKLLNKFMINGFLRPTDIKVLKHQHIVRKSEIDENEKKVEWLVLNHPATKTTAYPVQAMPKIVPAYDELIAFRKKAHDLAVKLGIAQEGSPYLKPDDYVFFPNYKNRTTMMAVWGRLFRAVVKESGLKEQTGKNIQLYSLRHTSIMYRLMKSNVDSLILAKNARTSQAVIEQFYGAHLTTEQARRQLHSFLPAKKKAKDIS